MKTKKIYCFGTLLALLGFLLAGTSCSHDSEPSLESPAAQVVLTFRAEGGLDTRTVLPPNTDGTVQGVQHVTDVHLYIYDGTEADARCIAVENVGWWDYFGGASLLPGHTADMCYVLNTRLTSGKRYTLLAVGLDNRAFDQNIDWDGITSGATYGLPDGIAVGSRLGDAVASLSTGKGLSDIARSELYAGSLVVTPQGNHVTDAVLELNRRVAGLQAYFADLPADIVQVRVLLYRSQNTAVPLLEGDKDASHFTDYKDSPFGGDVNDYAGRVLLDIPIPSSRAGRASGEGHADGGDGGMEDIKYFGGTLFLLPMPAPGDDCDYTLMVEFIPASATGIVGDARRVKLAAGPDGNLMYDTELGTGIIDDPSLYRYPIVANHFYSLGTPQAPIGYPKD